MTSGKQAKATSLSTITREEVTEMMVLVAMANGPMVLSSSKNSVDDTFVGRWHICNAKKMQGVSPINDGSQVSEWIRRGVRDGVGKSPLIALSGSEGGFAEVESPVMTADQRTMANEQSPTSGGQRAAAN